MGYPTVTQKREEFAFAEYYSYIDLHALKGSLDNLLPSCFPLIVMVPEGDLMVYLMFSDVFQS